MLHKLIPVDQMPAPTREGRFWLWADGSLCPVVAGGSTGQGDDGDANTEADPKPAPEQSVTLTQAQLDAQAKGIRTEAERSAKKAAEKALAEALGVPLDEAKKIITERKSAEEAAQSEADKREAAATKRENEATAREAAATAKERAADAKVALIEAGINPERLKRATSMLLADLDSDADEAAVTTAAEALKKEMPELFGAPPTERAPSGDPSGGPKPGGKGAPTGIEAGRQRALAAANGSDKTNPLDGLRVIGQA